MLHGVSSTYICILHVESSPDRHAAGLGSSLHWYISTTINGYSKIKIILKYRNITRCYMHKKHAQDHTTIINDRLYKLHKKSCL